MCVTRKEDSMKRLKCSVMNIESGQGWKGSLEVF